MKRLADYFLAKWRTSSWRTPLLVRGARQVGKTHTVQQFGKTFPSFVELNFEQVPEAQKIFEPDFYAQRIVQAIEGITRRSIIPGKTLLFLDEVQAAPKALIALRYLYEEIPELHVIAAGSLLDFAIEQVGLPVGRVTSLYMHPLSFAEYLSAVGSAIRLEGILSTQVRDLGDVVHSAILREVSEYLMIGGMPRIVASWVEKKDLLDTLIQPHALLAAYRQDFNKYAQQFQLKYLEAVFESVPRQLGGKFKYSAVEGGFRKRELVPCLDLLQTAGVVRRIRRTSAQGIPIGAGAYADDFKAMMLDVALSQYMLSFDPKDWVLDPLNMFVNKGPVVEAFVGQELIAYSHPMKIPGLYYWQRETPGSEAEVDYVIQRYDKIIPIEVKSGAGKTLKSMQQFLDSHPHSPYGMRFSTLPYSIHDKIHSHPLYALSQVCTEHDEEMRAALMSLM